MFHHFTAIDVDLNEEREPCLELDMHEAEMPVKEIEVIVFTFAVYSIKGEQAVVMLLGWRVWQYSTTERMQMSPSSTGWS